MSLGVEEEDVECDYKAEYTKDDVGAPLDVGEGGSDKVCNCKVEAVFLFGWLVVCGLDIERKGGNSTHIQLVAAEAPTPNARYFNGKTSEQ